MHPTFESCALCCVYVSLISKFDQQNQFQVGSNTKFKSSVGRALAC